MRLNTNTLNLFKGTKLYSTTKKGYIRDPNFASTSLEYLNRFAKEVEIKTCRRVYMDLGEFDRLVVYIDENMIIRDIGYE